MLGPGGRSSSFRPIGRGVILLAALWPWGCRERGSASQSADSSTDPAAATQPASFAIRVRLASEVDRLELAVEGPYQLRRARGAVVWSSEDRLTPQVLTAVGEAAHGFKLLGRIWGGDVIEVATTRDGTLRLKLAGMEQFNAYQGLLRCHLTKSGRFDVINELGMEDYLRGVVTSEMPNSFHPDALRAQAIVARTYAFYQRNAGGENRTWDVKAGQGSQVYTGLTRQRDAPAGVEAVDATRGVVCTWASLAGRRIFCTYYSAACGGCTQPASNIVNGHIAGPLCGNVKCDYCSECKYYRWGPEQIGKATIVERLRKHYPRFVEFKGIANIETLEPTPDGRPTRIRVTDDAGRSGSLRAEDFRLAVDSTGRVLKSTHFVITMDADNVTFSNGRGYGHGVGMCQWGADGLARRGWTTGEILAYYYPGCRLALAYR